MKAAPDRYQSEWRCVVTRRSHPGITWKALWARPGLRWLLLIGALAALPAAIWVHRPPTAAERRREVILEAQSFPAGQALLIGDSITQSMSISELCGLKVLNAGIVRTRVEDWERLAPYLVAKTRPRIVVYALGVNDASDRFKFDPGAWSEAYRKLRTPGGYVMGVWPIEPLKNPNFLPERVAAMNGLLASQARYIHPDSGHFTRDGVHLTRTGKRLWRQRLESICRGHERMSFGREPATSTARPK